MEVFKEYLESIENLDHRGRMEEILTWISKTFPHLGKRIAWSQPMFTDHGTFILGLSISKHHIAISPEQKGIREFSKRIEESGYIATKMLFRIKWKDPIDYKLLEDMISFNIEDKADCSTFWRK